jgi:hypothetical protein
MSELWPVSGVLEQFLSYWNNLPRDANSVLPARSALNPSSLHHMLPRIAVLKRLDRYNVTATMLCTEYAKRWTGPVVGMNAFDLTAANMRENTAELYSAVLDQPAAALIRETVSRKGGRSADVASLYLPLANRLGAPTYIIGCTVYERRPTYTSINDRLILDHQRVRNIEFLDIGAGQPSYQFERPTPRGPEQSETKWWDRFIPAKSRSDTPRLDA